MILIHQGQRVLARTSADKLLPRRAATGVVPGEDFQVVWVCPEDEWEKAKQEEREPRATPWPANEVQPAPD